MLLILYLGKEMNMPRPKLSNITIETLKKELDRRIARVEALKAQRDKLDREIAELEGFAGQTFSTAARKPGPKPGKKRGPKPGRKTRAARGGAKPLGQYIQQVLAGAPGGMSVASLEEAVIAAGYKTKAESIYNPILKVIRKGGYVKVTRGVYALASAKAAAKSARKAAKKASKKAAKTSAAPVKAKGARKRKKYAQTAEQFVISLVKDKGALSSDINKAWKSAGRTGRADNTLNKMLNSGKLKRQKIVGTKGSMYTVA